MTVHAQNITVRGTVLSASDSEPLIGASVVVAGQKSLAVATDIDGNFQLTVPEGSDLQVSYIGFRDKTVKAEPSMTIVLEEDTRLLDEVVVVGYSTQKKADVTGAITAVNVDELAKQNENNPVKALRAVSPA